jgi:RimJ/RimL family protein N-acetyltransferase
MSQASTSLLRSLPRPRPDGRPFAGRFVRLERLDAASHGAGLGEVLSGPATIHLYDYLFELPPEHPTDVAARVAKVAGQTDPFFYAVVDTKTGAPIGPLALMRIVPEHGVIEVGSFLYAPVLQRTPAATEVQFLLMRHVFEDLGYRRYEWKCNNRNLPSKRAAVRYGFSYEGVFRQHMVVKGENRDTAWFAMTDEDWTHLKPAYETWLAPANFDAAGRQKMALGALTAAALGRTA